MFFFFIVVFVVVWFDNSNLFLGNNFIGNLFGVFIDDEIIIKKFKMIFDV